MPGLNKRTADLVQADQRAVERVAAMSTQVCEITEIAAKAIALELSYIAHPPAELGEMYEQIANVYLNLADQIRLKRVGS